MDVRTAECRNPDDTKAILNELEQGVACNTLVLGLLREALIAQARLALWGGCRRPSGGRLR